MDDLIYRDARLDDASFAADVYTAVAPHRPVDPVVQRYEWEHGYDSYVIRRFVVERGGRPIGIASFDHPRWDLAPSRFGSVGGEVSPDVRGVPLLSAVYAEMERRLRADGAQTVAARANEDDEQRIATILGLGYREDRRGRRWELDLVKERDRILAMNEESRARMASQGVRLLTLADDVDPERYAKIHRMSSEAEQDVPTTLPHVDDTLEDYMRWFRAPNMREDRFWIARAGEDIVGVSVLGYPPVRGFVGTEWTATARRARGRGIARALKCETLVQAIALGVDRVRTGNDAKNDPILHINATIGYRPIAGGINYLKGAG